MTESLNCPYCKGEAASNDWKFAYETGTTIECKRCGVSVHEGIEGGDNFHERAVNAWKRKTNIIKLRFLRDGEPQGREYTYFTPASVSVGNTVDIDGHKKGVITAVDVPEEEIAAFGDRVKTIVGIAITESTEERVTVYDGKYTLVFNQGKFRCLRYGEEWRDLTGDGMVYALFARIQELEEQITRNQEDSENVK